MIISALPESEYYNPENAKYDVYLDGIKQTYCYFANEEEGYIERYKTNKKGELILNLLRDEIDTEKIYGCVSVVITKENKN